MTGAIIPLTVVLLGVFVAAVTDVRTYRVYNVLTLPMFVLGLVYHLVTGGASGLLISFLGALAGFVALLVLFLMGAAGAGDVKLATAVGAWLGAAWVAPILAIALIATAVYSAVLLIVQKRFREAWVSLQVSLIQVATLSRHLFAVDNCEAIAESVKRPDRRRRLVPFSLMLAVGVVATMAADQLGWISL